MTRKKKKNLRDLRDSWRVKENECRKTEMARERWERDVMNVWSRFTLSSSYHETSPGGDNHTAADLCVCKRLGCQLMSATVGLF